MCAGVIGAKAKHTLRAQWMGSGVWIVVGRRLVVESGTHIHFQEFSSSFSPRQCSVTEMVT